MRSIFSSLRGRTETPGAESPPEPTPVEVTTEATAGTVLASPVMAAIPPSLDNFLQDVRNIFAPEYIPRAQLEVSSLAEQPIGLSNFRGQETWGPLLVAEIRGGRLDCLLAFHVLAPTMEELADLAQQLIDRLALDRDSLTGAYGRVLRLSLERSDPMGHTTAPEGWHRALYYRVLYEYQYLDEDAALGLIARIPIEIDSEYGESTVVTDEMIRWGKDAAPTLIVRGRFCVGGLSALVFVPGAAPGEGVTLTRTFDGAVGPLTIYPTLASFLAAVTDLDAPDRHGQVAFTTFSDFLTAFDATGDSVTLGDGDEDGLPDSYELRELSFEPSIPLPSTTDCLKIACPDGAFGQVATVYLRAIRR